MKFGTPPRPGCTTLSAEALESFSCESTCKHAYPSPAHVSKTRYRANSERKRGFRGPPLVQARPNIRFLPIHYRRVTTKRSTPLNARHGSCLDISTETELGRTCQWAQGVLRAARLRRTHPPLATTRPAKRPSARAGGTWRRARVLPRPDPCSSSSQLHRCALTSSRTPLHPLTPLSPECTRRKIKCKQSILLRFPDVPQYDPRQPSAEPR